MGADNTFGETNFNPDSGTIKASDAYQTTITEKAKATDVNYNGERLCKQKGCTNHNNDYSDYCDSCYDEKYWYTHQQQSLEKEWDKDFANCVTSGSRVENVKYALYKSQVAGATNREAAWFWQKAKVIAQDEKFTVLEVWSPFGSPTILTIPTEEVYFLE